MTGNDIMTAPDSKLVEQVAMAISQWMNGKKLHEVPNWERLQESPRQAYRDQARAALAACHAGEMRDTLVKMTRQLKAVEPRYSRDDAVIAEAEALLARLDGEAA